MTFVHNSEFDAIKSKLARSLKDTLTKDAATPEGERPVDCEVHVPYHQLAADDTEPLTASALVTYVVHGATEKKHTVRIKFNYDKSGKFLKNSMTYV
jgi:hypothetical protein